MHVAKVTEMVLLSQLRQLWVGGPALQLGAYASACAPKASPS